MKMVKRWTFMLFGLLLFACNSKDSCDAPANVDTEDLSIEFEDLTHEINAIETEEALSTFFASHPDIRDYFFDYAAQPSEESLLNEVLKLVQTPRIQRLLRASTYANFQQQLERNREIREYLTYDYLSINQGKSLEDLYGLLKTSTITQLTSTEQIKVYLDANPREKEYFHLIFGFRSNQKLLSDNLELLKNAYVDTLYQETFNLINTGKVAYELDQAFNRIQDHYPDFEAPKVQTVYSAFGKDIFFTDSLLILGLDYYLGEEASYRPNVYDYLKVRLTPEHLVPQVMQFASLKYNKTKPDKRNVLEEMIFYGKAMEFVKEMLPCTADSLIIGYTHQQLADATVSEGLIWSFFLENKLLYDNNANSIVKYVDERPNIPEIGKRCPGRIGQWLGWQIVKAYREAQDVDFVDLMNETDAQKILTQSKYRPRSR